MDPFELDDDDREFLRGLSSRKALSGEVLSRLFSLFGDIFESLEIENRLWTIFNYLNQIENRPGSDYLVSYSVEKNGFTLTGMEDCGDHEFWVSYRDFFDPEYIEGLKKKVEAKKSKWQQERDHQEYQVYLRLKEKFENS